ncbi:MarR family winged helix-turn-helix transcriptional regulator [Streptomyces sp. NBC_00582]|uniref:MarR family winged helix-turn-helix transcriptional regulator n=1 Tax=Streptomyces sp. NBC_00582 TaxID=2975783 RepID=UPI002E81FAB3|nr:hypothetical protein [Streptomyces sp. NBC_00582]WUB67530.1 hypothetical protein OG852_47680 [Streptomyces sp. NBC_00582]
MGTEGPFHSYATEEFGLLLKALTREADRRGNGLLRPLGITTSQAEALQLVDRYGPMSLCELGTLLIAEGGHPGRLVDRLVASGLREREPAGDDRRRIEITYTPRGSELADAARERKEIFRAWSRERLGGVDLTSTTSLLETCLIETPLSETVRQRRSRPIAGEAPQRPKDRARCTTLSSGGVHHPHFLIFIMVIFAVAKARPTARNPMAAPWGGLSFDTCPLLPLGSSRRHEPFARDRVADEVGEVGEVTVVGLVPQGGFKFPVAVGCR